MWLYSVDDLSHLFLAVNVGEDCPVFDGLFEFCQLSAGGSAGKSEETRVVFAVDVVHILYVQATVSVSRWDCVVTATNQRHWPVSANTFTTVI